MLIWNRVVTVLMALSSLVFYILSNRVQLVSFTVISDYVAADSPAKTCHSLPSRYRNHSFIYHLSRSRYRTRHGLEIRHI
jgi:hypothetical protein